MTYNINKGSSAIRKNELIISRKTNELLNSRIHFLNKETISRRARLQNIFKKKNNLIVQMFY